MDLTTENMTVLNPWGRIQDHLFVKRQGNRSNIAWTEGLLIRNKMLQAGKSNALIKLKTKPRKLTSSCLPQLNLNQAVVRYLMFVPWHQIFRIFHKVAYGIQMLLGRELVCMFWQICQNPVTGRSPVRVAVSSHCTGVGKACHWHPSPDPAQSGSSLHWVRPFYTSANCRIV